MQGDIGSKPGFWVPGRKRVVVLTSVVAVILLIFLAASVRYHETLFSFFGSKIEVVQPSSLTQSRSEETPLAQQFPANQVQTLSGNVNPVTMAAVQSGVLGGASRINQITEFLASGNPAGAFLFPSSKAPDKHMFSVSLEILPENSNPLYATASFAPNLAGGWDAVYDTFEYIDHPVEKVAQQLFGGLSPGRIGRDIMVYEAGDIRFFLMPAGRGSVLIKKEVVR